MKIGQAWVVMVVLSLVVPVSSISLVRADEADQAPLRQQIEAINRRLDDMQTELDRLKKDRSVAPVTSAVPGAGAPVAPAGSAAPASVPVEAAQAPAPPAAPDAFRWREAVKDQWGGIKNGMSDEQIRQLLGAPAREFTLNGQPVWYYTYPGVGNGSVMFGRDGHKVVGWQHPPFGFW